MRAWREAHTHDTAELQVVDVFGLSTAERVPFVEHCLHKFLLHMPGVSNSGCFKYLLR